MRGNALRRPDAQESVASAKARLTRFERQMHAVRNGAGLVSRDITRWANPDGIPPSQRQGLAQQQGAGA